MPTSKPMKWVSFVMDEDEKKQLQRVAAERQITLSYAIREGLRLYLDEFGGKREPDPSVVRLRATR